MLTFGGANERYIAAVEAIQTEIRRKIPGKQCLLLALEMSDFARELAAQRIRDDHLHWLPGLVTRELIRISFLLANLPAGF